MKFFTTQDQVWIDRWDDFIEKHPQGSHLQYSYWVKSYMSYGFSFEIGLSVSDDEIVGGYAAVIASKFGFGFYCVSNGPIVHLSDPDTFNGLLELAKLAAQKRKCCCLQITAPNSNEFGDFAFFLGNDNSVKKGKPFPFIFASSGLNWVDFKDSVGSEDYLKMHVKSNLRRDIRSAQRRNTSVNKITCEKELELAYMLFENNAKIQNYSVRNWKDFKESLIDLVGSGKAVVFGCSYDGELKGAILLIKAGGYFTYVMGGTIKEKPDLLIGELLQWNAIVESFENGFKGYNISLGGSKGVIDFKNKFTSKQQLFTNNTYYYVLKPLRFSMYLKIAFMLKKFKPIMAKFLSKESC